MHRKYIFPVILAFFTMQHAWSQIPDLPNLFSGETSYTYFTGSAEPDTGWNQPGFNDTLWLTGTHCIGYGDGDDTTLIDTTTSVYLRISFTVEDKSQFEKANLMVDFDDGFVAYLNGNEIARVNLGKWGEHVPHDRLADRSHEACFYRIYYSPLCGYFIGTDTLSKYLADGENILAFQVHNDSLKGSDLSFKASLLDLTNENYNLYSNTSHYIKQVTLDSTRFPIVVISTDEYGLPRAHTRYIASMGIIDGTVNTPSDAFSGFEGRISIEIRGKSSADFPKKSYGFETQDSLGENLNISLMGMPPENDWVLFGPFTDKSLIRNEMAFLLGRKTGRYQPRTRFCELILNGEYLGLYVLTEKIKRDSRRVNIAELTPTDLTGDDLTGGYLFTLEYGNLEMRDPDYDELMPRQWEYIDGFYDEFLSVLDSPYMADPFRGYRKYMDEQSLIDYIIINEAIRNCDAYYLSDYAYKDRDDRDGRLKYGPLWDNDLAFGNSIFQEGFKTTGWQFEINQYLRLTHVMRDTSFTRQLAEKWHRLRRDGYLRTDSLMHAIDSIARTIEEPRIRNYEIWPIIDKALFFQYEPYVTSSYEEEIAFMKDYFTQRLQWIDENISGLYYPMPSALSSITSGQRCLVYPNPFTDALTLCLIPGGGVNMSIQIIDLTGRTVLYSQIRPPDGENSEVHLAGDALAGLTPGFYAILVKKDGSVVFQQKIIKR